MRHAPQNKTKGTRVTRGRPLSFDRDAALDAAMVVFWEQGYEGTSIDDLKRAMGLSASSIYAAFGAKEALYLKTIDRYRATTGGFGKPIFEEAADARTALERLLLSTASELTRTDQPRGCMISIALMYGSDEVASARSAVAEKRKIGIGAIRRRIQRDIDAGRLSKTVKASELTAFFVAVIQGMSARSRDGASSAELEVIARLAMKAWPD